MITFYTRPEGPPVGELGLPDECLPVHRVSRAVVDGLGGEEIRAELRRLGLVELGRDPRDEEIVLFVEA